MTVDNSLDALVESEVERLTISGKTYDFKYNPLCRICDSEQARLVNSMLTNGSSYRAILRTLAPYNETKEKQERIGYNSLRTHAVKHFPVQASGRNVMRDIMEQRAAEQGIDFVEGVASIVTPMAIMDIVMHKGLERLVANRDPITPDLALRAAERLQHFLSQREDNAEVEELQLQLNQLIDAVKKNVPEEYWRQIVNDLNGATIPAPAPIEAEAVESSEE